MFEELIETTIYSDLASENSTSKLSTRTSPQYTLGNKPLLDFNPAATKAIG